ncbi:integrin alpha-11 isoform X1 [Oryzias melastigma]|uniref:integrin alpha-11 isoform X1 n=1 Tax=Oryzias melastigma TaxID=30732 RepID=UPI00168D65CF|nr:integrin alpha-11 isoform X1 [Oryzias melastigma]
MKKFKIFSGSKDAQFGYTVQQHQAGGRAWLLVGAPFESTAGQQTGDIYKCPLDHRNSANCSRLNLGKVSIDNVSERKEQMRLGLTLISNPKDNSFVTCGPLWSHECGSSLYSTGFCARANRNFKVTHAFAPALQSIHPSTHPSNPFILICLVITFLSFFVGCETFMDIVIVLDGSNSIYPWYEVQDFITKVLHKFYIGPDQTQVGVVQYGSTVVHEFSLGEYQTVDTVVEAVRNIDQRGGYETRTALAINVARSEAFQRGGRSGAQKVMIVITDGESHDSIELVDAVNNSKNDNITMYAIAVLGYYNRRGIDPKAFLEEIKFIASDPDEKHLFKVTEESALKDIVDALGERIFSLEGTSSKGQGFGLQMAQAGFSSHLVKDGVLLGAVGAYDWNGAVLKETKFGKVIPPKSFYQEEFPEALKNHAAYLGYSVSSLVSSRGSQFYVAGAPRFNHTGKVIIFTLKNSGNLTILRALLGEQIGSYFGSELLSMDIDNNGYTDYLLIAAPMFYRDGWERGRVYVYSLGPQTSFILQEVLEVSDRSQNSRLGSALAQITDMNGDGCSEVVVGAPLEDDHQGAVYLFYSRDKIIQPSYKQRLSAAGFSAGLQYFGQSLHGVLDINSDGLVDLAVGALGAAVIVMSRGVVRIEASLTFQPEKVNIFNKDCRRGGKDVTCMNVTVCLSLDRSVKTQTKSGTAVGVLYSLVFDERRPSPRAVMDDPQQLLAIFLQTGGQACDRLSFTVQETADFWRPIVVVMEARLQNPDEGPMLDPDWPSSWRSELHFWNGCEQEENCAPDLVLHSRTDMKNAQQYCSWREQTAYSFCEQDDPLFVVESGRRRMVVFARLENQGENAYRAAVNISNSANLLFSRLLVKGQSDIQIECSITNITATWRSCNITNPFMKSLSQVSFHLEFEFSPSVLLDHARVVMEASSDGVERNPSDNINSISLPLKFEADLLFTRDPYSPHFGIRADSSSSSWDQSDTPDSTFNLTFYIQNLGIFSVMDLHFRADIWAVTMAMNQLVDMIDYAIEEQADDSSCSIPHSEETGAAAPEDLSHLSQLNHSNSVSMVVLCRLSVPPSTQVKVTLMGRLRLSVLHAISFKSLELLSAASLQLEASSPMFLQEDRPVRQILLHLRKEEETSVPIWIILGSSIGGLLLLGLLVLGLWKLGFFKRQRRQEEEEEPAASGKSAQQL